jgi:hypothetical protein
MEIRVKINEMNKQKHKIIEAKFIKLKRAERDFLKEISQIKDEDEMINIMEHLKKIGLQANIEPIKPKELPNYIG